MAERHQVIGQTAMLAEMRLGLSEPIRSLALASLGGESPHTPGGGSVTRLDRGARRHRLAAGLRVRPFAVLEQLGGDAAVMVGAALGFAGLSVNARERVLALGQRLTGRAGRRAIDSHKVALALERAVAAADWRAGNGDFVGEWLRQLAKLASLSEQVALKRLVEGVVEAVDVPPAKAQKVPAAGVRTRVGGLLGIVGFPRRSAVRRAFGNSRQRMLLVKALAEGELAALLAWVCPGLASGLLHVAERIGSVRRSAGAPVARTEQWLAVLAAATSDGHAVMRLTSIMLDGGAGCPAPSPLVRHKVEAGLARSLEGMRDAPLRIALDLRKQARAKQSGPVEGAAEATICVGNAGLVLLSAYLPRLFEALTWIEADKAGGWRWVSREVQDRAPHLLQWLADERSDAAEPEMVLPKLLCGLPPADVIPPEIQLEAEELRLAKMLLATMRANWPPLADSSVQALRETFLQRGGRLTKKPEGWALDVETKVLDVLLEQLPWGFSTIAHGWMPEPLTVRWR